MNPSSLNEMPGLNLPTPDIQQNQLNQNLINPEISPGTIGLLPGSELDYSAAQGVAIPLVQPTYYSNPSQNIPLSQPTGNITPTQQAVTDIPTSVHDGVRLENEWILKVKQIVNSTKSDPFMQAQKIAELKADYIKKRFNKDIAIGNG